MIEIREIKDKKTWEDFLNEYVGANFLQSYNWGEFQKSMGNQVWRLGIYNKNILKGVVQFYKEKAKRGHYFACPGGPLLDFSQKEEFESLLAYIKLLGKKEKVWFFRCRPQLINSLANKDLFSKYNFYKSPMHLTADLTLQLDISKDLDEILKGMRKNTRYAVRKAEKSKLKIVQSQKLEYIDLLFKLQTKTQQKHKFVAFSKSFFQKQFAVFLADNQAVLFLAYQGDILCAVAFIIFYKDEAVYHYAGNSSLAYKNNASYLIQWEAIKEAKKRNLKKYNFWGVAPKDSPKHRYWGVSIFKRGFGGEEVSYLSARDLLISPCYYLTRVFEFGRKRLRKL